MKRWLALLLFFLFTMLPVAAASEWQAACTDANGTYAFNPASICTIDSDDVIQAQIKHTFSDAGRQKLIHHYGYTLDVTGWENVSYAISVMRFNLNDRFAFIKDVALYDDTHHVLTEFVADDTLDMTSGSTLEKIASILAQRLYEQ